MVENEVELTFAELLALPLEESTTTLTCVSNEVGGDLIGNATWLGYPIRHLLARAKPSADADMVLSTSQDGWTASTPIEALTDDRNAILAVGMNGQPLPLEHGYPVRMVVPGLYGYVSATKWVVVAGGHPLRPGTPRTGPTAAGRSAARSSCRRASTFPPAGAPGEGRDGRGRRRRLVAARRRQRRARAGRRRPLAGGDPRRRDLRRHLAAVAVRVGRDAGRAHPAGPRDRRERAWCRPRRSSATSCPNGATGLHTIQVTVV